MKLPLLIIAGTAFLIGCQSPTTHSATTDTRLWRMLATEIFINIVAEERIIALDVKPGDKIKAIKVKISQREKIPVEQQQLVFAGQELENEKLVSDYNIQKDATLQLIRQAAGLPDTPER